MATEKQKLFLNRLIVNKGNMFRSALEAGYSETTARAASKIIKGSKGFQDLLNEIDDKALLDKLNEIALDVSDKRACIDAIKELFKLKDRYPASKLKVQEYEEELNRIKK